MWYIKRNNHVHAQISYARWTGEPLLILVVIRQVILGNCVFSSVYISMFSYKLTIWFTLIYSFNFMLTHWLSWMCKSYRGKWCKVLNSDVIIFDNVGCRYGVYMHLKSQEGGAFGSIYPKQEGDQKMMLKLIPRYCFLIFFYLVSYNGFLWFIDVRNS